MKLVLDNVTKKYKDKTALNQLNAELESGQLIGLIGKNGAGKTTLLKLLATILRPTAGKILLDDVDIVKHPDIMRTMIGYLPQDIALYPNLTAFEYLNYIASIKGLEKKYAARQIDDLLSQFHLSTASTKRLYGFSGGMKRRIGIICALLGNPKVIVADEPAAGLDPEERITLRNVLAHLAQEKIVILSTHIVSDIEAVASRIMILKQGSMIFNNTPGKLISNVRGYVWEYTLSALPDNLKGISNMVQTEAGIHIRQVVREKPNQNAVPVHGSLEDACLFVFEESNL